jgi:hypothetical protein
MPGPLGQAWSSTDPHAAIGMSDATAADLRELNERIEATRVFLSRLEARRMTLLAGGAVGPLAEPGDDFRHNLDELRALNDRLEEAVDAMRLEPQIERAEAEDHDRFQSDDVALNY